MDKSPEMGKQFVCFEERVTEVPRVAGAPREDGVRGGCPHEVSIVFQTPREAVRKTQVQGNTLLSRHF